MSSRGRPNGTHFVGGRGSCRAAWNMISNDSRGSAGASPSRITNVSHKSSTIGGTAPGDTALYSAGGSRVEDIPVLTSGSASDSPIVIALDTIRYQVC